MELQELKFAGLANNIAEKELGGAFGEDRDRHFMTELYQEFVAAGEPSDSKKWLRGRLSMAFRCAANRPEWLEKIPMWPFENGRPMTFIAQIDVPPGTVSQECLVPGARLYVFGARVPVDGGWEMKYRTIEQQSGLP